LISGTFLLFQKIIKKIALFFAVIGVLRACYRVEEGGEGIYAESVGNLIVIYGNNLSLENILVVLPFIFAGCACIGVQLALAGGFGLICRQANIKVDVLIFYAVVRAKLKELYYG